MVFSQLYHVCTDLNAQFTGSTYTTKYTEYVRRLNALEKADKLDLPGLLREIQSEVKTNVEPDPSGGSQDESSVYDALELEEW